MEGISKKLPIIEKESIQDPEIHEGLGNQVYEIILGYLNDGSRKIGKGLSAEVHYTGEKQKACVKIISRKTLDSSREFRSVFREADMQEKAREVLEVTGLDVLIPKSYFEYEIKDVDDENLENRIDVMCMERLNAVSLIDILENRVELPESFNFEEFFKKLRMAVRTLHENNIYHRDLRPGNIMLDVETGSPCIIDFEFAIQIIGDEDPYKESNIKGTKIYPNDESEVNRLYRLVLKYLSERKDV